MRVFLFYCLFKSLLLTENLNLLIMLLKDSDKSFKHNTPSIFLTGVVLIDFLFFLMTLLWIFIII
jgi:hypothetical protein